MRRIPRTKASDAELWFSLICTWINACVNNRKAGDFRRHRAHYDVIVMPRPSQTRKVSRSTWALIQRNKTQIKLWHIDRLLFLVTKIYMIVMDKMQNFLGIRTRSNRWNFVKTIKSYNIRCIFVYASMLLCWLQTLNQRLCNYPKIIYMQVSIKMFDK